MSKLEVKPLAIRLMVIFGLTFSYYLCGEISLLLAIPPGYASIVWPAAGIALAAILVFGSACWPGIFVGSFLLNLGSDFVVTDFASFASGLLLPGSLACGATAQAVFSAYLVRRLVGFPLAFSQIHQVSKAFLLGGPIGCLVSSTLGTSSLFAAGVLSAQAFSSNWLTWWVGDQIGVLIVLPLALAWNQNLLESGSRTMMTVLLPLGVALVLVVGLFFQVRTNEIERERQLFKIRSDLLGVSFVDALQAHMDDLYAIEGLSRSSLQIERHEFSEFVAYSLARHPGVQALEWIPRVPHNQLSVYENAARGDGFAGFIFFEQSEDKLKVPVSEREYYYPVYFLEPYLGNESALGFDLGSNPDRLTTLEKARDKGAPVASGRIRLVQDVTEQVAVLVFLPVYDRKDDQFTVNLRRQHLKGYALGVFRVGDMLQSALAAYDRWGIHSSLFDRSAPAASQLLYRADREVEGASKKYQEFAKTLSNRIDFDFASRNWELYFSPSEQYLAGVTFTESRALLIGGLLFAGLVGNALLVTAGRNVAVRQLVAERTASLAQANEALLAGEAQQRAIVDNAVDGIATIDQRGHLLTFNAAAEGLFGYLAEEVIGKNVKILQPEPYHSEHDEYLRRYMHSGVPHVIGIGREVTGRRKDGSIFPLELSVGEINLNHSRQFIGILRDITERKQAEIDMQEANEKLKQVDQLKSLFIASMSHELRTPLNAIIGFTSILEEEWVGPLNTEQKENLAIVSRSGKHLLALINDVIDISKIEGGQLDSHIDAFDIFEVIEEVVDTLKAQAEVQKLELRVVNLHHELRTDRLRLLQCILNLLSNAIKYTEKGWIELTIVPMVTKGEAVPMVQIRVADSGIGISPEDQEQLFKPFVRLDTPLKSRHLGTGLGLYLSHKLASEVLHGTLECESQLGQGSCFSLIVPEVSEEL